MRRRHGRKENVDREREGWMVGAYLEELRRRQVGVRRKHPATTILPAVTTVTKTGVTEGTQPTRKRALGTRRPKPEDDKPKDDKPKDDDSLIKRSPETSAVLIGESRVSWSQRTFLPFRRFVGLLPSVGFHVIYKPSKYPCLRCATSEN